MADTMIDIGALMLDIGRRARAAARPLAFADTAAKNKALLAMADAIDAARTDILAANTLDMQRAEANGISGSFLDRLLLNETRLAGISEGIRAIAALKDPVGETIAAWERPNGLKIERVRTPLGVIGVIYESRPNVTADAGALCLKAGNAVILRGGSDSLHSSRAIHACLVAGLRAAGLPEDAIQLVPVSDRAAVGAMLTGLDGNIDVIVPRGGKSLVGRVQSEARVPVFAHLEGLCHVYVDASSQPQRFSRAPRSTAPAPLLKTVSSIQLSVISGEYSRELCIGKAPYPARRRRKNCCNNSPASSASTPRVTSTRWLNSGRPSTSTTVPSAPKRVSLAP